MSTMSPKGRRWRSLLMAAILVAFVSHPLDAQGNGFPLTVTNPTSIDRLQAPIASGIALPRDCPVFDPQTTLRLVDSLNAPVPCQFKVLSRWGGQRENINLPIKWLLVEFQADVLAGQTSTYYLQIGARALGAMSLVSTTQEVRVNTGAALFKIDKTAFSIFKSVTIGGAVVTGGAGALEVRNPAGQLVPVNLLSTVVEENGSVRTVVMQRGNFTGLGLSFTVRYYFTSGHTDVRVDFRLENTGAYGEGLNYMGSATETAWFEDLKLVLKTPDNFSSVTTSDANRGTQGSPYELRQTWSVPAVLTDMLSGFNFSETINGMFLANGTRYSGAIALNGVGGSIAAGVDRFWQNFPKAFECQGNRLAVALWPAFGHGPEFGGQYSMPTSPVTDPLSLTCYRLEGGRFKTHTVWFDFRGPQPFSVADTAIVAAKACAPLMALAPQPWNFGCFAYGAMVVDRRPSANVSNQRFEKIMDVLAKDTAADYQDSLGRVGLPLFRNRGGTYGGDQMYGWTNFGDVTWGDGYSSLHYDLAWGVLINYHRTGDYAFFDMARDMVAQRRDYDQYHSKNSTSVRRGGQFYEKGWTHGNYTAPEPSHTWVHGLLTWYAMTGDESAREAAIEVGQFIQRQHPENWDGWWGSRILGWQLEGLVHLWNYIGDPAYLTLASSTANRFKTLEIQWGQKGYVPNPAWTGNVHEQTWMHCIVHSAMSKYFFASGDASILPCLQRMSNWILSDVVKQLPSGPVTACTLAEVWGRAADTYHAEESIHHLWVTTDALSSAAMIFDDPAYMTAATMMWECVTRYHQEVASPTTVKNYTSATGFSKIAFRMLMYPNAETKIMSNIALWGQAFPMARLLWDGQW